jgi:hypothetical protein
MDRLYVEWDRDKFEGIAVNQEFEPELQNFINDIRNGNHKFDDYPPEQIEYFASRIYELRKNNSNNTAG